MFKRMSYITQGMLDKFSGRPRMAHAVLFLQPLVEVMSAAYRAHMEDHRQVIAGVREAFHLHDEPSDARLSHGPGRGPGHDRGRGSPATDQMRRGRAVLSRQRLGAVAHARRRC